MAEIGCAIRLFQANLAYQHGAAARRINVGCIKPEGPERVDTGDTHPFSTGLQQEQTPASLVILIFAADASAQTSQE